MELVVSTPNLQVRFMRGCREGLGTGRKEALSSRSTSWEDRHGPSLLIQLEPQKPQIYLENNAGISHYTCLHIYIYMYIYIYIYLYIHRYVCMYICIRIFVYAYCMHIFVYTQMRATAPRPALVAMESQKQWQPSEAGGSSATALPLVVPLEMMQTFIVITRGVATTIILLLLLLRRR